MAEREYEDEPLALIDLDGTLIDYDKALKRDMDRLKSPDEPEFSYQRDKEPDYIRARMDLIRSDPKWWANLPRFKLGWDILEVLLELDYDLMVLTQGPKKNANAWKGKMEWCLSNIVDIDVDITRRKRGRFGKVLVDDWPEYVLEWLKDRPRGLVIMPAQEWNQDFEHPQVIRYDGTNLDQVREALVKVRRRKPLEPLEI